MFSHFHAGAKIWSGLRRCYSAAMGAGPDDSDTLASSDWGVSVALRHASVTIASMWPCPGTPPSISGDADHARRGSAARSRRGEWRNARSGRIPAVIDHRVALAGEVHVGERRSARRTAPASWSSRCCDRAGSGKAIRAIGAEGQQFMRVVDCRADRVRKRVGEQAPAQDRWSRCATNAARGGAADRQWHERAPAAACGRRCPRACRRPAPGVGEAGAVRFRAEWSPWRRQPEDRETGHPATSAARKAATVGGSGSLHR